MKKIISLLLIMNSLLFPAIAQNDAQYAHTMFNDFIYNPAAISNQNRVNVCMMGRKQWYGFPTSPSSQLLSGTTFIQDMYGGIGAMLQNDKVGVENTINFKAAYNYSFQVDKNHMVALGASLGFITKSVDGSQLRFEDRTDQYAVLDKASHFSGDASFGAELNTTHNYSVGLAISHLNKIFKVGGKGRQDLELENASHIYLNGRYIYPVNDDIKLMPYLLIKSSLFITQFDLNCIATFDRDLWWTGLTYRLSDALVIMGGYNYEQRYRIGYSYEFGVGGIRTFSNGSHEIMLSASFDGFNKTRVKPKTPRLFE